MSPTMKQLTQQQEGFKSKQYLDSVGVPTIGFGTNLLQGITVRQASALFDCEADDNRFRLVTFAWFLGLDPIRQDVIENMAYNIGVEGVCGFHNMISAINARDWQAASAAMLDSLWSKQVGQRATVLAAIMSSGHFPLHFSS